MSPLLSGMGLPWGSRTSHSPFTIRGPSGIGLTVNGMRVSFLVRAHADAKRYLCAADPGYYDTLSPGSKHTLALQGGIMTADEAVSVATQPWWPDALRLRRWDDEAKIVGKNTRPLSAWGPLLRKYFADSR